MLLTFRSSGLGDVILWKQTEEALSAHHQARHHCGERILLILCCSQIWRRGNIEVPSSLPASPPPLLLWQGAWLASPLLVTQRQGLRWTRPCFFTSLFAVSGSAVFLLLLLTDWLKAAQGECRVLWTPWTGRQHALVPSSDVSASVFLKATLLSSPVRSPGYYLLYICVPEIPSLSCSSIILV